ncbi:unnamed protein product, partial [Protopolystoma xenopodis]
MTFFPSFRLLPGRSANRVGLRSGQARSSESLNPGHDAACRQAALKLLPAIRPTRVAGSSGQLSTRPTAHVASSAGSAPTDVSSGLVTTTPAGPTFQAGNFFATNRLNVKLGPDGLPTTASSADPAAASAAFLHLAPLLLPCPSASAQAVPLTTTLTPTPTSAGGLTSPLDILFPMPSKTIDDLTLAAGPPPSHLTKLRNRQLLQQQQLLRQHQQQQQQNSPLYRLSSQFHPAYAQICPSLASTQFPAPLAVGDQSPQLHLPPGATFIFPPPPLPLPPQQPQASSALQPGAMMMPVFPTWLSPPPLPTPLSSSSLSPSEHTAVRHTDQSPWQPHLEARRRQPLTITRPPRMTGAAKMPPEGPLNAKAVLFPPKGRPDSHWKRGQIIYTSETK